MKRILTIVLLIASVTLTAQVAPPLPNTYVNDLSGNLTKDAIQQLNEQLRALEDKYTVQMAIVLLPELTAGYDVEKYAIEVGRTWHVGNAGNGLVYVAAIKERKQRLEVAGKLQGTITDVDASELLDHMKGYFRQKEYHDGLANLIHEIDVKLTPATAEQKQLGAAELQKKNDEDGSVFWWLLIIPIGGLIYLIYRMVREKKEPESVYHDPIGYDRINARRGGDTYITPVIINNDDSYRSSYTPSYSSSSDSSSSSSSSSDYGSWGSDSSSSSSSSFDGGGSSSDW